MHPREGLSRIGTPVSEQPVLDVLGLQGLAQQRIRPQVKHARAKIVTGTPVSIHFPQFVGSQWRKFDSRSVGSSGRSGNAAQVVTSCKGVGWVPRSRSSLDGSSCKV